MNDKTLCPAIAGKVADMDQYETVFVGFPIWWYVAPSIINTFLESYDFSGKTVIPFATSGGSGMGKTNTGLAPSCPGASLLDGKMLNEMQSQADLIRCLLQRQGGGTMKKMMSLLLVMMAALSLIACGRSDRQESGSKQTEQDGDGTKKILVAYFSWADNAVQDDIDAMTPPV